MSSSWLKKNNNGLHRFTGSIYQHVISMFKARPMNNYSILSTLLRCACCSNFIHKLLNEIHSNFQLFHFIPTLRLF